VSEDVGWLAGGPSCTCEASGYTSCPINVDVEVGRFVVRQYHIIGAPRWVVREVLQPSALMGDHQVVTHRDGRWWGKLTSKRLPAHLDALPARTTERWVAVREWHARREDAEKRLVAFALGGRESGVANGKVVRQIAR
jgi:hypothetical protein